MRALEGRGLHVPNRRARSRVKGEEQLETFLFELLVDVLPADSGLNHLGYGKRRDKVNEQEL